MEELSLDNILEEGQIEELFPTEEQQEKDTPEKKSQEETTEVTDPEELFPSDEPESVGSEDNKDKEGTDSPDANTSPNFYSSIASAFVEDSIFQTLDKDKVADIKTAEDLAEAMEQELNGRLDEAQKRINEALTAGLEPTEIQKHERYLQVLNSITDDRLEDESTEGENLRKNIIYQEYINRGFSKERASREVERSFKAGTDIEDAKEALISNKEFYSEQYDNLLKQAKEEKKAEEKKLQQQAEELKNSILEGKKAFGEIDLDKSTRQKVYDSIMKPVYKDPETGERLTAIQKYESENRTEFLKNVGLIYVLTDGFKNLDGLVKGKVNKEVKKSLRELERTINNTSRTSSGSLKFTSGVDGNSRYSKFDLDID